MPDRIIHRSLGEGRHVRFVPRDYVLVDGNRSTTLNYIIEDLEHEAHTTRHIVTSASRGHRKQHAVLELLAHGANILLDASMKLGCAADELADVLDPALYIQTLRDAAESMRGLIAEIAELDLPIDTKPYAAAADAWNRVLVALPSVSRGAIHNHTRRRLLSTMRPTKITIELDDSTARDFALLIHDTLISPEEKALEYVKAGISREITEILDAPTAKSKRPPKAISTTKRSAAPKQSGSTPRRQRLDAAELDATRTEILAMASADRDNHGLSKQMIRTATGRDQRYIDATVKTLVAEHRLRREGATSLTRYFAITN